MTVLMALAATGLAALFYGGEATDSVQDIAPAGAIVGVARVIDADTLEIDGCRVRLLHIDACEIRQPADTGTARIDCGAWAAAELRTLVNNTPLRCTPHGLDPYNRILAECFLPGGQSLSVAMLRVGLAFPYREGGLPDEHRTALRRARAGGLGVWSFLDVMEPGAYRRNRDRAR